MTENNGPLDEGDGPVLDALQPRMEEIIFAKLPNIGRLCGYCYNHLAPDGRECKLCGRTIDEYPPAGEVPRPVLRAYFAKRRREAWMVNTFAYLGMFVGVAVSFVIVTYLPGWWKLIALFTLTVGSWYMANLLGGLFGGNFGYNWGRRVRNRMWAEFVRERDALGSPALRASRSPDAPGGSGKAPPGGATGRGSAPAEQHGG